METFWTYALFIAAFFLLAKGADMLIQGAEMIARRLHISTILISLTVVALGSVVPVLIISIFAVMMDRSEIAIGSVIGSNLATLMLIIGISATISPVKINKDVALREFPLNVLASIVLLATIADSYFDLMADNRIDRGDGVILICFFLLYIYYLGRMAYIEHEITEEEEKKNGKMFQLKTEKKHNPLWKGFLWLVFGLALLYIGGEWVVNGVQSIADEFGISDFIISTTVVAIGTSIPGLLLSIEASKKKDVDVSVGDNIGSCILRIFLVLGVVSIIDVVPVADETIIDAIFVVAASILLMLFIFLGKKYEIDKWKGVALLLGYLGYLVFLAFYK
jgi:cation:H+ antiporter